MTTKAEVLEQSALDCERLVRLVRRNADLGPVCEALDAMDRWDRDAVLLSALVNLARADAQLEAHRGVYEAATSVLRRGG